MAKALVTVTGLVFAALAAASPAGATFPGKNGPLVYQYGAGPSSKGKLRLQWLSGQRRSERLEVGASTLDVNAAGNAILTSLGDNVAQFHSLRGDAFGTRPTGGSENFSAIDVAIARDGKRAVAVGCRFPSSAPNANCVGDFIYVSRPRADADVLVEAQGSPATSTDVDWSPREDTLAIVKDVEDDVGAYRSVLYSMPAAGGQAKVLLDDPDNELAIGPPSFSPDGQRIAVKLSGLDSEGGDTGGIAVLNADGSGEPKLLPVGAPAVELVNPVWSPDGLRLAMIRVIPPKKYAVVVMDADGGPLTTLDTVSGPERIISLDWAVKDEKKPRLKDVKVSPERIAYTKKGKLRFKASEPVTLETRLKGGTRKLLRSGKPGKNTVRFPTIKGGKYLEPGDYTLYVVAVDGQGNRSRRHQVGFEVKE